MRSITFLPSCVPFVGAHGDRRPAREAVKEGALVTALCMAVLPVMAQADVTWQLPTAVQSAAEVARPVQRRNWRTPSRPPFVRDAAGRAQIAPADRPPVPLFDLGTVVTTGFSGTVLKRPLTRPGQVEPDLDALRYRFLNPNGAVATLLGADGIGFAHNGAELTRAPYDKILARDVGQVFGIAIDNEDFRNLYLGASSAYGLNIVGADVDEDNVPDRLLTGDPGATWMGAQWGNDVTAGPGSIWRVSGETGQVSLFANVHLDGQENTGPGLGNIAFDGDHDQLFVSDLQTGLIHRFDLFGQEQGLFDHGAGLQTPVEFDPAGVMDITSPRFDGEDPDSWGFAAPARRVWGMAVHGGRLFYAVAEGPEIWSVGIDRETGEFLDDARWELSVSDKHPVLEVSDIAFTGDGAMVLAQRGARLGDFEHKALTRARKAEVLRYVYENPEDPETPSAWVEEPTLYPVGFAANMTNALGGVAVGPRYDDTGSWDMRTCGGTLWTTGESLRTHRDLRAALELGGELEIDGLQAQPVVLDLTGNMPPWRSYFSDFDGRYDSAEFTGQVGDVEVLGCRGRGGHSEDYVTWADTGLPTGDGPDTGWDTDADYNNTGGGCIGASCVPTCLLYPWLCGGGGGDPAPEPCLAVQEVATCDPVTGTYTWNGQFSDVNGNGLDQIKITDAAGMLGNISADQSLTQAFSTSLAGLAPGQPAQLTLCGYNAADKATGQPYACCNASVTITAPDAACEKEAN